MAKTVTLSTIVNPLTSADEINTNFSALNDAFDNTLSRDGSTPNVMTADFDMNGKSILNLDSVSVSSLFVLGQRVLSTTSVPSWRSDWSTGTSYVVTNLVSESGNSYICVVDHTSGATFSADLSAGNWELFAEKGDSGDGTGDMLASQNLSDVASATTSRSNLGLGSISTQDANSVSISGGSVTGITDLAIADGGTGAGTASAAFTALKQAATETDTGVVEKATSAEATSGVGADKFPDVTLVKSMVDAFCNKSFVTSSEISIVAGGATSYAHGLSSTPSDAKVYLLCKSADANWAVGDLMPVDGNGGFSSGTGISYAIRSTSIEMVVGTNASPIRINNKTTGAETSADLSKWRLVIRAYV